MERAAYNNENRIEPSRREPNSPVDRSIWMCTKYRTDTELFAGKQVDP
jgi:hypothetical protein